MHYRWSKDVEPMEMDGEWILINSQDFTLTKLEDLGGFIWSHFREPSSLEHVIERVLEEYDTTKEQVSQDVERFLNQLLQLQLVESISVESHAL